MAMYKDSHFTKIDPLVTDRDTNHIQNCSSQVGDKHM